MLIPSAFQPVRKQIEHDTPVPDTSDRQAPPLLEAFNTTLNRALLPFEPPRTRQAQRDRLDESGTATTARKASALVKLLAVSVDSLEAAIGMLGTRWVASFECFAATTFTLHLGWPHTHLHPPALLIPLPSIGPVLLGNCVSVLIGGLPAARVDDFGLAVGCGTFTPPFQIATGSSKVFIGGKRAARVSDMTKHCQTAAKIIPSTLDALSQLLPTAAALALAHTERKRHARDEQDASDAMARATDGSQRALARTLAAEGQAHALAAGIQTQQAVHNAAALAASLIMGKDPSTTPCFGALITGDTRVLIGGLPMPSTTGMLKSSGKVLSGLGKILSIATRSSLAIDIFYALSEGSSSMGRASNALPRERCVLTGHPVDVVNGRLVFDAIDLELAGALPLRLARSYSSTWSRRITPLGRGWSHSLDEAVWLERHRLVYRAGDGRELELSIPDDELYLPLHRLTLRRLSGDRWQIEDHHGLRRDFAPIPGDAHPHHARLIERRDRLGHSERYSYDAQARLITVQADGDRELRFHYHDNGLLAQIDLPDPDGPGFVPHVRYVYDQEHLLEIHDALGQVTRYRHEHHRIVEEQLPGGLGFHFAYDGNDPDAACIRTWGDGGIVDHRLIFDRARRTTVVINACQETTIYRAEARGLVIEIQDPRGAITRFTHDDLQRPAEIVDPLGHVTRFEYDPRGNCIRHHAPDGALSITTYDGRLDLPVALTDPAGGQWRWTHDKYGRLLRATDPLGRSTVHHHELSPETGHTLVTTLHPGGRSERRTLDNAGRLLRIDLSDGTYVTHTHDRRGRLRRSVDERGRVEARDHDLLGRLTRHTLPDGQLRHFSHEAGGQVVRACDPRSDLRCTYSGLGWLTSCGEGNAPPLTLERDLEGRLTRIAGPTGTLLRIERDPAGRVRLTVDALGVRRRFTRDLAGRTIELRIEGDAPTRFTRDPAGRIVEVTHGDGRERIHDLHTYRPDGALLGATRHHPDGRVTVIQRELDLLGRIILEQQDEHSVRAEYDLQGRLIRLRSSLGADFRYHHDERGLTRVEHGSTGWGINFERDRDGHERARHLPGEVLSWWQRDRDGRPREHGLIAARPPQIHRQRRYTWGPDHRLRAIEECARRRTLALAPLAPPSNIEHDPAGRRIRTHLSDGTSWTYRHNPAGELTRASRASTATNTTTIDYRHDALGRRVTRAHNGAEVRWIWHGDVPLHELGGDEPVTWLFEPDRFTPIARLGATRHAIIGDHLGVPLALLDERGQLAWSAEIDPSGHPRPVRGDPTLCPFRGPGQLADPDTGLLYNRFRDLDPSTRSYLIPDPLGLIGGLDPHAHVADPRTETDVFGLTPDDAPEFQAHARIAAELSRDFPISDLPPAIAQVLRDPVAGPDRQTRILRALNTPARPTCG
ncbi:MAG: PAAR domain-containing protein [Nannocystis sp.]|nr:DUF6531 domain-containing protein [Nannocystis sp.]MBA3545559.1 PAAR domain-containing protein [Nannocystis sp.]